MLTREGNPEVDLSQKGKVILSESANNRLVRTVVDRGRKGHGIPGFKRSVWIENNGRPFHSFMYLIC